MTALLRWIGFVLGLTLFACTPQQKDDHREGASVPAPPAAPRVQRQVLRASWTFETRNEECIASAAAGRTALQVTVRRNAPIRLTISFVTLNSAEAVRQGPVRVRFNGPAGNWQVLAQQIASRQLTVSLGADDNALSRVLVLLSGGVIEMGEQEQGLPSLSVPSSEANGQSWFDCARNKML